MKRTFDFEFQKYKWISDTETEPIKLADIVVIDVPDELTDTLAIFNFAKKVFLENEDTPNIDVTSIRELRTQTDVDERTEHWKKPVKHKEL